MAGIKCSRSFGKLGNNMGGPSPPLQNQASGFLPPIYKGTLLFALLFLHTHWVIKRQMAKVEDEGNEDDEDDGIDIEDEE